jgi:hypothetical protein
MPFMCAERPSCGESVDDDDEAVVLYEPLESTAIIWKSRFMRQKQLSDPNAKMKRAALRSLSDAKGPIAHLEDRVQSAKSRLYRPTKATTQRILQLKAAAPLDPDFCRGSSEIRRSVPRISAAILRGHAIFHILHPNAHQKLIVFRDNRYRCRRCPVYRSRKIRTATERRAIVLPPLRADPGVTAHGQSRRAFQTAPS